MQRTASTLLPSTEHNVHTNWMSVMSAIKNSIENIKRRRATGHQITVIIDIEINYSQQWVELSCYPKKTCLRPKLGLFKHTQKDAKERGRESKGHRKLLEDFNLSGKNKCHFNEVTINIIIKMMGRKKCRTVGKLTTVMQNPN